MVRKYHTKRKDCSLGFWHFKNSPRAKSASADNYQNEVSKSGLGLAVNPSLWIGENDKGGFKAGLNMGPRFQAEELLQRGAELILPVSTVSGQLSVSAGIFPEETPKLKVGFILSGYLGSTTTEDRELATGFQAGFEIGI